ncbi:MAG: hypothetical protein RR499_06630, partial [Mucinivorans sp.]
MKKIAILLTTMVTTLASMAGNPLLEERWTTPHETPPFALIKPEHFIPAIEQQIQHARQRLNMIVMQRSVPTFENTIVALETNDHLLARTLGVFYNLNSAETTPELQKIALEISPILTAYGNDVSLNEGLFQKVKQVYDRRAELALSVEDAMLLEKTYKSFARSGANLVGADRDKYRALTAELAELSVKFDQNELAAT